MSPPAVFAVAEEHLGVPSSSQNSRAVNIADEETFRVNAKLQSVFFAH